MEGTSLFEAMHILPVMVFLKVIPLLLQSVHCLAEDGSLA